MNDQEPSPEGIKYGIVAYTVVGDKEHPQLDILHFVGYWEHPTKNDWDHIEKELDTDTEFEICNGRINKDVFLMAATQEMIDFYTSKVPDAEKLPIKYE